MKKKMYLLLLAVLSLSMVFVAGCGSDTSSAGDKVKISYAIWDKNQKPAMDAIAEEFHKENPNITVEIQVIP